MRASPHRPYNGGGGILYCIWAYDYVTPRSCICARLYFAWNVRSSGETDQTDLIAMAYRIWSPSRRPLGSPPRSGATSQPAPTCAHTSQRQKTHARLNISIHVHTIPNFWRVLRARVAMTEKLPRCWRYDEQTHTVAHRTASMRATWSSARIHRRSPPPPSICYAQQRATDGR